MATTSPPPTRLLAGITVPDTPLITAALTLAHTHLTPEVYNHVVRSWLFGTYIADHTPSLASRDYELHAITAILHDMGWASTSSTPSNSTPAYTFITPTKRFEVDGANLAREFLKNEGAPEEWDKHRLQLAWDAVALHTTPSIAAEKEIEVQACQLGIGMDFSGWQGTVMEEEVWEGIVKEVRFFFSFSLSFLLSPFLLFSSPISINSIKSRKDTSKK